jgi:hypothetical protein
MTTSPGARAAISFLSCGRSGGRAGDLLAKHLFTSCRLELGKPAQFDQYLGFDADILAAAGLADCTATDHPRPTRFDPERPFMA